VARVFRVDGRSITLYRHQTQAVAKAMARQSFAVTTGTGSGKSLCFFIPIIDAAIRARASGDESRTRAIVIYPMNALANSQREELNKFLDQSGLPENLRPTFARYTGQEDKNERVQITEAKPDILLTNFMMLELLMTRQSKLDQTVIENAQGLEFIVLDELHTYRGRQGRTWRCWCAGCVIASAAIARPSVSARRRQCRARTTTPSVPSPLRKWPRGSLEPTFRRTR
jgi:ATP-dependent helicase YprA (DUF1998 family)